MFGFFKRYNDEVNRGIAAEKEKTRLKEKKERKELEESVICTVFGGKIVNEADYGSCKIKHKYLIYQSITLKNHVTLYKITVSKHISSSDISFHTLNHFAIRLENADEVKAKIKSHFKSQKSSKGNDYFNADVLCIFNKKHKFVKSHNSMYL